MTLARDFVDQCRDYYVENPITLEQLAMEAETLFGRGVEYRALQRYAIRERWGVLKTRFEHGKEGLPETVAEEVADLREQVYDTIMDPENKPGPRDLNSLISAFMNLRAAGGARMGTARTAMQDVLEIVEEVEHGQG